MHKFLLQTAENDLSSKQYHPGREVSEYALHALEFGEKAQ